LEHSFCYCYVCKRNERSSI